MRMIFGSDFQRGMHNLLDLTRTPLKSSQIYENVIKVFLLYLGELD